jgi:hypothetical protein
MKTKTIFGLSLLFIPVVLGLLYSRNIIDQGIYDWLTNHNNLELRFIVNFTFWIIIGFIPSTIFLKILQSKT